MAIKDEMILEEEITTQPEVEKEQEVQEVQETVEEVPTVQEEVTEVEKESTVVEEEVETFVIRERDFTWESLASVEISTQNDLISEIYSLMSSGDNDRIEFIKKEWESLSAEGIDPKLESRFQDAIRKYENRFENMEKAQDLKKALIAKVEEIKNSDNWAKTADAMHKMQDEWKAAGFAGIDIDQDLWEKFSAAKNHFFDRRKQNYKDMKENHEKAAVIKEELIAKAQEIKDSTEWKETSDAMHGLMDEWKAAGFAGREVDQQLWERFNEARQVFYAAQKEYYDGLRSMYASAKTAKEGIIENAKALLNEPVGEETRLKYVALFENWKEIGSAGRKHEQKLWNEFKEIQDEFYNKLKNNRRQDLEDKASMAQEDTERLEVRIQALEQLNEMIEIKLQGLRNNPETEEILAEITELETNKEDNSNKLSEYYAQIDDLNKYM